MFAIWIDLRRVLGYVLHFTVPQIYHTASRPFRVSKNKVSAATPKIDHLSVSAQLALIIRGEFDLDSM